ncbi:MAG: 23S rRNA (guanosine(2251)-2'-O)-methyltransferase RlmB [Glaciecola sp.]|jgi:23S rRNA (guanosine2251-2'-O)-methyltransferase|nr:23S rRNA (guanosine(2251)-2'-O)-methyltransferase RlmB [Glaciecola sp.]MDG1468673.1 23S rRNA (guanosine(2251)-2'-O)-methyltransferase RlmB [Glaciecola sp.]MDG1922077.1 23S rRNA (guanosine(2251)-2'-O)-methyltransferase RlmB [Glaciecola sp.]
MAQTHEWLYGIHALTAVLEREPQRILEIYIAKGRDDERLHTLINLARKNGLGIQFCNKKILDDKAQGESHQGVVARAQPAKALTENDLDEIITHAQNMGKAPFLLVLDGVTDPHNLGAVLRSADAAGVDAVIVTKDKSASLNATVRKVACGAADVIPLIQVTNLSRTLAELQEKAIWVVGTAGEATQSVFDCKMNGPIALVMGAEGKGMRRLTRERCDELIKLPMHGTVSSLNVSVATGICLYEILRQRG